MSTPPAQKRVAFAGTPEFAAVALDALLRAGFEVPLVLTQPDRPAGRGLQLHPSPVKALAVAQGCPLAQPRSLRLDGRFASDASQARESLIAARPDVMVVAAYGLILPAWALELPPGGCLNVHASLLPRWRGAAPIQRAIEAGDSRTGITIMQMDAGLDTGDMLVSEAAEIGPAETSASLHSRLAALGGQLIVRALTQLATTGRIHLTPQPEDGVTYAHKISKDEAAIDWHQSAVTIERRVRAFDPFPGSSFSWQGEVVKVWKALALADRHGAAGEVLEMQADRLIIGCGEGALEVVEVQRPGGRRMPIGRFLHSGPGALLRRGVGLGMPR